MKIKQIVGEAQKQQLPASKPRNFVAKNATTGGAGAHKDKKKAAKQGDEKHKGKALDLAESEHGELTIGQQMARDGVMYNPDNEDALIGMMADYMQRNGYNSKQIRYLLSYDEDFIGDQLSDLPRESDEHPDNPKNWGGDHNDQAMWDQEHGMGEGIGKSIKRAVQGWGNDAFHGGLDGADTGPRAVVKRNKSYDDETVSRLHKTAGGSDHSPAGLQKRVLDREMKKRNLSELSREKVDKYSQDADMDIVKAHRVRGPQAAAGDKAAVAKTDKRIDKRLKGIDAAAKRLEEGSVHGYNVMKVNAKHDQLKITAWLRKQLGLPKDAPLYFDDADLVWIDKTIVPNALVNPKLKMNDLLTATVRATGQGQAMSDQGGYYREAGVAEDGEPIGTIGSVQGDQVTIKNTDGSETKTTAAAVLPGPDGKTAQMAPGAAGGLKPGTPVTAEGTKDKDTIASGNRDVGGDATDNFINSVRDKRYEKKTAGRSTLPEGDELMKWLTIAGLK